ncbi:MAG: amidophosphoribosyltransferase, partial [Duncaniella sp.]|nr:amidophosphoribosyltransferase [Duncaniella sp.]
PKRIIIVSSSPQVRYPDYYGIDMSRMGEFIAFRAAVELLKERGLGYILEDTYQKCLAQEKLLDYEITNCVKAVYAPFSQEDISAKIARMLTADGSIKAEVQLVYQSLEGLREAIPDCPGDWYFSGNYPTPGGTRLVNRAFINYFEGNTEKR